MERSAERCGQRDGPDRPVPFRPDDRSKTMGEHIDAWAVSIAAEIVPFTGRLAATRLASTRTPVASNCNTDRDG